MKMVIAKRVFKVASASLLGNLSRGNLSWAIDIRSHPMWVHEEQWIPRAYSERLLPIDDMHLVRWSDAFRQKITWQSCYNESQGVVNASLYVAEHNDIYNSELSIIPAFSSKIEIKWKAKCDVFFDGYGDNLDLEINAEGSFDGIIVGKLGEEIEAQDAEARLRQHIEEGVFEFVPAKSEHEFPMMRLK